MDRAARYDTARLARQWGKAFAILYAIGAVSGTLESTQSPERRLMRL
jgi:cytochrome bd-type quinol oxidase subunit 1